MAITAKDVKELREKTGAGMMNCKKALSATDGNMEEAIDFLRTKGLAAAAKKQSRIAAEGVITTLVDGDKAVILEVNCETDFVSKGDEFQKFAKEIASDVLKNDIQDIKTLRENKEENVNELTLKCGEKIALRRFVGIKSEGYLAAYNHGGRIGSLVEFKTDVDKSNSEFQEMAKDIAMHVAAANPVFLSANDIDEDYKKRESEIYRAQLIEQGKPEKMIDKIIQGKLNKLASDICLLNQKFVKDPDLSIKKYVDSLSKKIGSSIEIVKFQKFTLGEGIEKKEDNLAEEVAKLAAAK